MVIETERLILREWRKEDANAIVDGLNDFNTAKNLTVPFPYTLQDAYDFLERCGKHTEFKYYFAICLKDNTVIGGMSVELDEAKRIARGGIWLNRKYVSKGYGTESFRARAKFAFDVLQVEKLVNGFFDFNEISWKMQQKLGYKIVGEKSNFSRALNKQVKEIVTELTKDNFVE